MSIFGNERLLPSWARISVAIRVEVGLERQRDHVVHHLHVLFELLRHAFRRFHIRIGQLAEFLEPGDARSRSRGCS